MKVAVWFIFGSFAAMAQDGAELFRNHCSTCHRAGSSTAAPLPEALRGLTPQTIVAALESGKMRAQGSLLSPAERNLVANYLGKAEGAQVMPTSASCTGKVDPGVGLDWNGWGAGAANTRSQTAAVGVTRGAVPKLKLKWAFGYPGVTTAFGSPTISGGRVYVGAADGAVYSLDHQTGCVYWTYRAAEGVRTAILISNDGQTAYFGDLQGNMYAVNANSGALLWKTRVDDHLYAEITGTPKLDGGRLYVPVSGGAEQVAAANPAFECLHVPRFPGGARYEDGRNPLEDLFDCRTREGLGAKHRRNEGVGSFGRGLVVLAHDRRSAKGDLRCHGRELL
jgi:polyvinyl alcohol dehydrogenase (cytochrome)